MAGENLLVVDDSPTILKVVESALTRAGYQVDTAPDVTSGLALARARRPAVILIDSLIGSDAPAAGNGDPAKSSQRTRTGGRASSPGGDEAAQPNAGLELCGALAADGVLGRTPVVLMTAKGEDLEARYAQSSNVMDYITKPFSPEAIVAVVTHVIEKTSAAARQGGDERGPANGAGPGQPGGAPGGRNESVAQALSQSIGTAPLHPVTRLSRALAARTEQLERSRARAGGGTPGPILPLDDEGLAAMLTEAGFDATGGAEGGPDLAGRLGSIALSEVINLLGQQGETGTLRVMTDASRVELFFRRGRIDLAAAVGVAEEFLLGRFAVEAGHLTADTLAHVLDERARVTGKPPLFGRDLTARGLLTAEQLKSALTRQTAELAYEALRWTRGSFQFRRSEELPELAADASLHITVDTLLLEGFRRVDEWRLIEREVQNFDLVFVRAEDRIAELPRGTLTRDEIAVLDALSGKSSVRDVIRSLRMGSFDVSKILYRLLRTKLIRRRVQPVAAS